MITRAIIEARLAENPRTECADCGCEEGCVDYLRARLSEFADAPELADEVIGNLCPDQDCHGGTVVIYHSMLRSWETGEYLDCEEVPCPTCEGLGFLTEPADPDPDLQEAHEKARRWTITRR